MVLVALYAPSHIAKLASHHLIIHFKELVLHGRVLFSLLVVLFIQDCITVKVVTLSIKVDSDWHFLHFFFNLQSEWFLRFTREIQSLIILVHSRSQMVFYIYLVRRKNGLVNEGSFFFPSLEVA